MHSAADNERRVICKSGSADSCRFRHILDLALRSSVTGIACGC